MNVWSAYLILLLSVLACTKPTEKIGAIVQSEHVSLASPRIVVDSVFFTHSAAIQMEMHYPDAVIHYTLDGSSPTTGSAIFARTIEVTESSTIHAAAFHPELLPSLNSATQVHKIRRPSPSISVHTTPKPSTSYPGNGVKSLTDLKKGSTNFRGNRHWLGFQNEVVTVQMNNDNPLHCTSVNLSILEDSGSWIFAPQQILIYADNQRIGSLELEVPEGPSDAALRVLSVEVEQGNYSSIIIEIRSLSEIPAWHPGAGTRPWLFIDEIFLG